ncbi:NAD(P)-binding protein [Dentipellis sp. KUC8613]|nr:NAD(P)-binding protein [Dentipellis sp. KUC8613]
MSKGVAFVTGAAQGMGRAIAVQLAKDGFDVAVNDIPSKLTLLEALVEEINNLDRKSIAAPGDVSSEDQVKAMVEESVAKLGSLDVMVANAGIYHTTWLLSSSLEEFDRTMSVNTRGPLLCYKYAAKQMIAQGRGGRIIGAASIAAKRPYPDSMFYNMSKFAVCGMTQAAAVELGEYNITVNAYAPGATMTPMMETAGGAIAAKYGISPDEYVRRVVDTIPLKRVGEPQDIANMVSFLASDKASYITGQTFSVDGGVAPS